MSWRDRPTLVLVTAVLGAGRWRTGEEPAVIDELTEIRGQQRCSYCEELQPLTSEEARPGGVKSS